MSTSTSTTIKNRDKPIVVSTWGTGQTKRTMAMHIKNSVYQKLGWNAGDFLLLTPDYDNDRIILERLDFSKLKGKKGKVKIQE